MKPVKGLSLAAVLCGVVASLPVMAAPPTRLIVEARWGYFLGGVVKGKWVKPEQARKMVRGGETYSLFNGTQALGTGKGSKVELMDGPCEGGYMVNIARAPDAIAVTNAARLMPRKLKVQSVDQAVYRDIVAKYLKTQGLAKPQVSLIKIWNVDLNGDGNAEVLIQAVRHSGKNVVPSPIPPNCKAGDYSILLLRNVTKNGVQTTPIASEVHTRDVEFGAPSIFELTAVLDLNGDGKMEIITRGSYYEGTGTTVSEWDGKKLRNVLDAACGA